MTSDVIDTVTPGAHTPAMTSRPRPTQRRPGANPPDGRCPRARGRAESAPHTPGTGLRDRAGRPAREPPSERARRGASPRTWSFTEDLRPQGRPSKLRDASQAPERDATRRGGSLNLSERREL